MSDGRWARRGWMATTALLGFVLISHTLLSFVGSYRAVEGLNRGQADFLGATLSELLAARGAIPESTVVAGFLKANTARGLRYVELTDSGIHAGRSNSDPAATPPQPDPLTGRLPLLTVRDRLRAFVAMPSRPAGVGPSYAILEFEPTASVRLMQSARRTLALALTAAVLLTLAGWMFLKTSIRYEAAQLGLERQRHLATLGEMSAVLAHEIRNPLAALKGHAQLALERLPTGSRERTCVEVVIESSRRLETLTTDLLDFSRTGALLATPTDPAELLRVAARDVFGDQAIALDQTAAPRHWLLDSIRVRQALINLFDNARQSSAPELLPVARVAEVERRLVFEIRDFGPGLPAGEERRIFDPFFTTRTNGTGLGLAVTRRVAEMHGGTITAENHPEGGAVFRLSIPYSTS